MPITDDKKKKRRLPSLDEVLKRAEENKKPEPQGVTGDILGQVGESISEGFSDFWESDNKLGKAIKFVGFDMPRAILGGMSEAGKTLQEFTLTFGRAALGEDLGEASLKAQETVRGSESQRELEKKLFGFQPKSFADYTDGIEDFLDKSEDATKFEKAVYPAIIPMAMFGLEMQPWGSVSKGVKRSVIRSVAKSVDSGEIAKKIKPFVKKGTDDQVQKISEHLTKVNDEESVERVLKAAMDLPGPKKAAKGAAKKGADDAAEGAAKGADDAGEVRSLEELAYEEPHLFRSAKEFDSEEEFLKHVLPRKMKEMTDSLRHRSEVVSNLVRRGADPEKIRVAKQNLLQEKKRFKLDLENMKGITKRQRKLAEEYALREKKGDFDLSPEKKPVFTDAKDLGRVFKNRDMEVRPETKLISGEKKAEALKRKTEFDQQTERVRLRSETARKKRLGSSSSVRGVDDAPSPAEAAREAADAPSPAEAARGADDAAQRSMEDPVGSMLEKERMFMEVNDDSFPVNKVFTESADKVRKKKSTSRHFIAVDEDGRPVVRESGVYADKRLETMELTQVTNRSLLGGQSFNMRDLSLAIEGTTAQQLAKNGKLGPLSQAAVWSDEAVNHILDYGSAKSQAIIKLAKSYKMKVKNNKDWKLAGRYALREELGDAAGIAAKTPRHIREFVDSDALRQHWNQLREEINVVRRSLGKENIPFRKNYFAHMEETAFLASKRSEKGFDAGDNIDFVNLTPNAKKNPHALSRKDGDMDLETDFAKVMERYHESAARDIYEAPVIEQIKANNKMLRSRGLSKEADLFDRMIKENMVGQPHAFDAFLGITDGTKSRALLNKVNMARGTHALAGNLVWIGFVQPASLALTAARAGPVNMVSGIFEFATSRKSREYVKGLQTVKTKQAGAGVGSTLAGDIDNLGGKITRSKTESFSQFVGTIADANEFWLTGASALAGRRRAAKLGMMGKTLDFYADWMGGATQSRYHKEARPLMSNSLVLRTSFPFQTFAFELYRYNKTLLGFPGGMALAKRERINQAITLLSGIYLYDQYLQNATGRRLSTEETNVGDGELPPIPGLVSRGNLVIPRVGSFLPMAGRTLEKGVNGAFETIGLREEGTVPGSAGREAAGALYQDLSRFKRAVDDLVQYHDIQGLRQEMIKWTMGFSGAAGASTVNNLVDGMIATATGYESDETGRKKFRIEGIDQYLAPIMGPDATRAGIEYKREGNSIVVQDAKKLKRRLDRMTPEEASEEFQELIDSGRNPNLVRMVTKLKENEENPILGKVRDLKVNNGMRAEAIVEEMDKLSPEERKKEYQKLLDKDGVITEKVTEQVQDILEDRRRAVEGEEPLFGIPQAMKTVVDTTVLYAKAIGTDPITAMDRILSGDKLKRIDNGAIIIDRMSFDESQAVKKERVSSSEMDDVKLDHTVPLQLGGSNKGDNLIIVSNSEHAFYSPIENLLGDYLNEEKISKKEAQRLIREFKRGEISPREILEKYPPLSGGRLEKYSGDIFEQFKEAGF